MYRSVDYLGQYILFSDAVLLRFGPIPVQHGLAIDRYVTVRSMKAPDFHMHRAHRYVHSYFRRPAAARRNAAGLACIAVGYCIAVNINRQCFNINRRRTRRFRWFPGYYIRVTERSSRAFRVTTSRECVLRARRTIV